MLLQVSRSCTRVVQAKNERTIQRERKRGRKSKRISGQVGQGGRFYGWYTYLLLAILQLGVCGAMVLHHGGVLEFAAATLHMLQYESK